MPWGVQFRHMTRGVTERDGTAAGGTCLPVGRDGDCAITGHVALARESRFVSRKRSQRFEARICADLATGRLIPIVIQFQSTEPAS